MSDEFDDSGESSPEGSPADTNTEVTEASSVDTYTEVTEASPAETYTEATEASPTYSFTEVTGGSPVDTYTEGGPVGTFMDMTEGSSVDTYTEVTQQGFGSRIVNSIAGVLIGVLLFVGSFVVFFVNEGRVDTSNIARTATVLSPGSVDPSANGKLVALSGALTTDELTGDNLFLRPGRFLAVQRNVEMYAWVEKSSSSTSTNVGGSQTTKTTYTYERQWVDRPAATSSFRVPQGHENPSLQIQDSLTRARTAKVGSYSVDLSTIDVSGLKPLALTANNITPAQGATPAGGYVFVGRGSLQSPQVGDVRVSYSTLDSGVNATVFGKLEGSTITTYVDRSNTRLFRVFPGSRDEAIGTLSTEYQTMTWILRAVGFLMNWFGLGLLFGPITTLLDVLPFLGSIGRALVGVVTFLVALVLSVVAILISILLHSLVALVVVAAVVAGIVFVPRLLKSRGAAPMAAPGRG